MDVERERLARARGAHEHRTSDLRKRRTSISDAHTREVMAGIPVKPGILVRVPHGDLPSLEKESSSDLHGGLGLERSESSLSSASPRGLHSSSSAGRLVSAAELEEEAVEDDLEELQAHVLVSTCPHQSCEGREHTLHGGANRAQGGGIWPIKSGPIA